MINLHNIDCMEFMRNVPDWHYDLAIADPPYGVGSVAYMPRTRHAAPGGFIDKYDVIIATLSLNQRDQCKTNVVHGRGRGGKQFGDSNIAPPPPATRN